MKVDRDLLLQTFREEADEHLDGLEQELLALEHRPTDAELIATLFRRAHTLKGNALVVGLQPIVDSAHVLEDALERLRDGHLRAEPRLVSVLLATADGLRRMVEQSLGEGHPEPAHLELQALLGALSGAATVVAPTASPSGFHLPTAALRGIRVGVDKLDKMLDLMGELTIARGQLGNLLASCAPWEALRDAHHDAERLSMELQQQVMRARMVEVSTIFRPHLRTVRDLSLAQGKKAQLLLEGGDVELDTSAVDALRDPLLHMVRNAVDHGLESPAVRVAAGKPELGTVALRARYEGGRVVIVVEDDGAGLSDQRLLQRARAAGLLGAEETPDPRALRELIFEPGFSTAEAVTDLSGRGVGMDVVKRSVESLRGTIRVEGEEGKGTRFTLVLPLTLAIIDGFSVGVGDQTYVLPLESVEECVELPRQGAKPDAPTGVLSLRGTPVPYLRLRRAFGLPGASAARESVVIVRVGAQRVGLAVDALHGDGQAVIKPLPRPVHSAPGVSGAAVLGNGRVALILELAALLEAAPHLHLTGEPA